MTTAQLELCGIPMDKWTSLYGFTEIVLASDSYIQISPTNRQYYFDSELECVWCRRSIGTLKEVSTDYSIPENYAKLEVNGKIYINRISNGGIYSKKLKTIYHEITSGFSDIVMVK